MVRAAFINTRALLNQGMILVGWASCPPENTRDGQDAHSTKLVKSSRNYATPTPEERVQQAEQRAQVLAEQLKSLGVDPDSLV